MYAVTVRFVTLTVTEQAVVQIFNSKQYRYKNSAIFIGNKIPRRCK